MMLSPCLVEIATITLEALKKDEELVALEALELWRIIVNGAKPDDPCFSVIKTNLSQLAGKLLETLLTQKKDEERDSWKVATAGGECLNLLARTVGDDIVSLVGPFMKVNRRGQEWKHREAAAKAFGSILEGLSIAKVAPVLNSALDFMLIALITDPDSHVRETTAWALGRMFEFFHGSIVDTPLITESNCKQILIVLLQTMNDSRTVAEKACVALNFVFKGYEDGGSSSPVTELFKEIVESLLTVTNKEDASEARLRSAAYETLIEVVRCSTNETIPMVYELLFARMYNKLEESVDAGSPDDREKNELRGLLCRCLEVIIRKLSSSELHKNFIVQNAEHFIRLFLRVFSCRSATVHEGAMLAIGSLAYATGPHFSSHMPEFFNYLQKDLQNFKEHQVCAATVGVVRDICMALKNEILPYCDNIMIILLQGLASDELHGSVKPTIFSCFGHIALAIGDNFERYLAEAVGRLQYAAEWISAKVSSPAVDDEMVEYIKLLRIGILEGYSGLFQGFKNSVKPQLMSPYADHILLFLNSIYAEKDVDAEVMKNADGVLGGLVDTLGPSPGLLVAKNLSSKCL